MAATTRLKWGFWRDLAPPMPEGMSEAEARAAAVLPPEDYIPPRYTLAERMRSAALWARALAVIAAETRKGALSRESGLFDTYRSRAFARRVLEAAEIRLRVSGTLPPRDEPVFFMWNQSSHLDHLVLAALIDRPVRSLYNREMARVPYYGEWLRAQGHYLVDRFDEQQWRSAIEQAGREARERRNFSFVVSPEGTRSWDGRLLPMKRGAFMLAIEAQLPIVAFVIDGAHRVLPRGSGVIRPGRIDVEIAPPVETAGYTQERRAELKRKVAQVWLSRLGPSPWHDEAAPNR